MNTKKKFNKIFRSVFGVSSYFLALFFVISVLSLIPDASYTTNDGFNAFTDWASLIIVVVPLIPTFFLITYFRGKDRRQSTYPEPNNIFPGTNESAIETAETVTLFIPSPYDELLPLAVQTVLDTCQASISLLQKRLHLSYSRAAHLIDQMEGMGIIGPFEASVPRRILISKDSEITFEDNTPLAPFSTLFGDKHQVPIGMTAKGYSRLVLEYIQKSVKKLRQSSDVFDFVYSYENYTDAVNLLIWLNEVKLVDMSPPPRNTLEKFAQNIPTTIDDFVSRRLERITSTGAQKAQELEYFLTEMLDNEVFSSLIAPENQHTISKIREEIRYINDRLRCEEFLKDAGLRPDLNFLPLDELDTIRALEKNIDSMYKDFQKNCYSEKSGIQMFESFKSNCQSSFFPLSVEVRLESLLSEYEQKFAEENVLRRIDSMDGHDFEKWCADLLSKNCFSNVEVTPGSGDHGVDVLAEKDGIHYAIQCKCYSHDLGNTPIQEVYAGKEMYRCQVGVVMTNRYFTPGAKALAEQTRVLLWDRDKLQSLIASAE